MEDDEIRNKEGDQENTMYFFIKKWDIMAIKKLPLNGTLELF